MPPITRMPSTCALASQKWTRARKLPDGSWIFWWPLRSVRTTRWLEVASPVTTRAVPVPGTFFTGAKDYGSRMSSSRMSLSSRTGARSARNGKPIHEKKGEIFKAWIQALLALGYDVSTRVLNCADHGDPTTRRRLFVTATRRHENPWPMPTHHGPKVKNPQGTKPWRAAREIIDWNLVGKSIFNRKKPLAQNTLKRIAAGLERYSDPDAAAPFLTAIRGKPLGGSIPVGPVQPMIVPQGGGGSLRPVTEPLPTIATKGAIQLMTPFIVPRYGERPTQAPRTHDIDAPMPTIPGSNQHHLCEPFLISYYSTGGPKSVDKPIPTLTAKARFGLVQPAHVDIHLRMLQPHELSAAMSFPKSYQFSGTKTERVKQIGNAVPVSTAAALCRAALSTASTASTITGTTNPTTVAGLQPSSRPRTRDHGG